ncbi:MAG TPA: hypothetical protein ENF73_05630 [Proteobacteria bacterium]|nr:hypothetical protein [Pseudomonadota bacterium]
MQGMRAWIVAAVLCAVIPSLALGDPYADQGWVLKRSGDITIYNRERAGSNVKELLMIFHVPQPPRVIFNVVRDLEHFKEFMPYTVVSEVLKRENEGDREIVYFFTILDLPLVKNRYYTIKLTNEADPDGKKGAFRSAWVLSDDPKLDPKPSDPSLKGVVDPKYYDCVKTKANQGYWLIEPSGSGSKVTYYVYTDPGGAVPAWIANKANSIAAPKLAKAVRERAKLPQYAK